MGIHTGAGSSPGENGVAANIENKNGDRGRGAPISPRRLQEQAHFPTWFLNQRRPPINW